MTVSEFSAASNPNVIVEYNIFNIDGDLIDTFVYDKIKEYDTAEYGYLKVCYYAGCRVLSVSPDGKRKLVVFAVDDYRKNPFWD